MILHHYFASQILFSSVKYLSSFHSSVVFLCPDQYKVFLRLVLDLVQAVWTNL